MKEYNCPNCGAPIGFTEKCEYCGTRIEWRPYVIHLAPQLYYYKTHYASAIEMVPKGPLGTDSSFTMRLARNELFERLSRQIQGNVKVRREDKGDAVFLHADIIYADKNERIGENE